MKNLTPEHMRCTLGACPAVYELDDGKLLIVGELAAYEQVPCASHETTIVIDRELLANVIAVSEREAAT